MTPLTSTSNSKTGDLYVQLIIKEEFDSGKDAGFGIIVAVGPEDIKKGRAPFSFTGVPKGIYGIRCFQDVNGTGKMEKGIFGPKEPWGTYRPARPTFHAPRFDEIAFEVNKDIKDIKIELKQLIANIYPLTSIYSKEKK